MRIALAGTGAFGIKHLDGLANIDGVTVTAVVSRNLEQAEEVAPEVQRRPRHDRPRRSPRPRRRGRRDLVHADPTARRRRRSPRSGRASTCRWRSRSPTAGRTRPRCSRVQEETGLTCMVGHTRRFNPSHQWVHRRIRAGELSIQQMDVQTYFFRRTNINAAGQPRSWTDHLLWHHAAHTVDLFQYQTGEQTQVANAVQGPIHPELGIAMDMSIQLRTASGQDLRALAQLQQRRAARQLLPVYLRQRHLHRPVRRPGDRPRGADRRVRGRRFRQRHRAAGQGVHRGDQRGPRSRIRASPTSSAATGCSGSWRAQLASQRQ